MYSNNNNSNEYQKYQPTPQVNNLVYGAPRVVKKSGPRRLFVLLTAITTTVVGIWTAVTLIVNGNINGRYAKYAGKDSAVYEIDRTFDEEAKSLEYAIAILDSPFPEEEEPGNDIEDIEDIGVSEPTPQPDSKEIWSQTRINLSKNLGYGRTLGERGMTEPNVVATEDEGVSFRFTYKDFSFMNESDLLNMWYGYGYNIDTNESYDIGGYYFNSCDGINRDKGSTPGYENESLFTYLQINGEYYLAGPSRLFKYFTEERSFNELAGYPKQISGKKYTRSSAKDGYIYIASGDETNPEMITIFKYDIREGTFFEPYEISSAGQNIDLYAGFVVDDKERFLFNKITQVGDADYEASIVSCTLDGKWEQRSEFGTLTSMLYNLSKYAFITLEQTDYGIVARSGDGILFYSFDTGSVSTVFDASDAYMFRADGPYVYSVPAPEIKLNNSAGYISVYYKDWGNFCLKRANVLTGEIQTIDLSAYYDVFDFVPFENVTNTRSATDEPANRPTCESNKDWDRDDLQRRATMRFICNMNQNKCVFGYYDDYWKFEGRHFVVAEIDEAGNVTCRSY